MKGKVESNIFQGLSKSTPMQLSMAEGAILESKWKRTGSQPCSRKVNFVSVCLLHFLSSSPQVCFSSSIAISSSFFLALFFSLTIPLHIYFSSCFFSFSHLYHLFTVFSGRRWLLPPSLRRRPRPTTSLTSSWTRWTKIHFQTRRWKTVRIWIICLRKASLYWMNF